MNLTMQLISGLWLHVKTFCKRLPAKKKTQMLPFTRVIVSPLVTTGISCTRRSHEKCLTIIYIARHYLLSIDGMKSRIQDWQYANQTTLMHYFIISVFTVLALYSQWEDVCEIWGQSHCVWTFPCEYTTYNSPQDGRRGKHVFCNRFLHIRLFTM